MNNLDRRKWLKSIGLTSAFLAFNGIEKVAASIEQRPLPYKGQALRLNANENPYGPSQKVRDAISNSFDEACRYPFRVMRDFVNAIAEKEGVSPENVTITGGSTEGLHATGLVYGLDRGEIIAADPTFQALLRYSENFGAYVNRVPLDDNLAHDLEAMSKRITNKTRLIFICNPNNPTGTLLPSDQLKNFITSTNDKAVIFSDEAYYDFITEPNYPSMVELVKQGRNVIVSKTFSKIYGLAGLRVGYLIARPDVTERLRAAVMANTNILAIEAAKTALADDEFYKYSIAKNVEAKGYLYNLFDELDLPYIKSHSNFVFFKTGRDIRTVMEGMKKENVLIGRPFPPMYEWARISTGTMEEVEIFGQALKKVLA